MQDALKRLKFASGCQYNIINYDKVSKMFCCCEQQTLHSEPRNMFQQHQQAEPWRFRLLEMLGLKSYLINKYVFSRRRPTYELIPGHNGLQMYNPKLYHPPEKYTHEVAVLDSDSHSIPLVLLSLTNRAHYLATLIYSHGNSSDLSQSLTFVSAMAQLHPYLDFIVYDYTGYGQSKLTQMTQESICSDLKTVMQWSQVSPAEIILWGFSLGTYPTGFVGGSTKVRGVILQSPLASIYSLFHSEISKFSSFRNDSFSLLDIIHHISSNLLIMHSQSDEVIPFIHALVLYDKYRTLNSNVDACMVSVANIRHNEMHRYLSFPVTNPLRQLFSKHLRRIAQHDGNKQVNKSYALMHQKEKYFASQLLDLQQGRMVHNERDFIQQFCHSNPQLAKPIQQSLQLAMDNDCSVPIMQEQSMQQISVPLVRCSYKKIVLNESNDVQQSSAKSDEGTIKVILDLQQRTRKVSPQQTQQLDYEIDEQPSKPLQPILLSLPNTASIYLNAASKSL